MNQTQKKYAMQRVDEITRRKENKCKTKYTVDSIVLSGREKLDLVIKGKAPKLKKPYLYNHSPYLTDIFDFSKFTRESSCDHAKMNKEMLPVYNEATRIKDQIMLGSETEALAMLEKFGKM